MPQLVTELLHAALHLSELERTELAELLVASLPEKSSYLHVAWADEIRKRIIEVDSGQVKVHYYGRSS
jgi:hypothetical protein